MTEPTHSTNRAIICGVDFTDPGRDAATVASALARALDARLELVHVVGPAGFALRDAAQRQREIAAATDALQAEAARLGGSREVEVSARVISGSPALRLVEAAAEIDACLIVVAASGPTPSIFRVGGTSERVIQAARIPVLLVRESAPMLAWLQGERLPVAAFVAEDAASDRVLDWLRTLRKVRTCDVTLLRAYYSSDAAATYGLAPRPMVMRNPEVESVLLRNLAARAATLDGKGTCDTDATFAIGRQADVLLAHPAARAADLIVVGNHRARGLARLSSVAANVVHLADASVLVVPATAPTLVEPPWPQLKRILVAVDFSAYSMWAVKHAYGLAARAGGAVIVLNVVEDASREPAQEASDEALTKLRQLIPEQPPVGVTTELEAVAEPNVGAAIVQAAARAVADCIVIASHGRTGIRKVLMGSTARSVLERSHLPVLIVRPPRDAETRPVSCSECPAHLMDRGELMRFVARDLMERNVLTVPESAPFREVQRLLVVASCHGAPVVDWEGRVVGIVTVMDLLRAADQAMDEDMDPDETSETHMSRLTAHELATPEPIWVQPDTPAYVIAQRMRAEGIHRVLVGIDGKLEGIVSSFDLARAVYE